MEYLCDSGGNTVLIKINKLRQSNWPAGLTIFEQFERVCAERSMIRIVISKVANKYNIITEITTGNSISNNFTQWIMIEYLTPGIEGAVRSN